MGLQKSVSNRSLGWLCLFAAALWIVYKFEYFNLLLAAWSNAPTGEFDKAAEIRLLILILSPGIILALVGLFVLTLSAIARRRSPTPPNGLPNA